MKTAESQEVAARLNFDAPLSNLVWFLLINLISLTAYELHQILTNLGENISDEEVAEMCTLYV